jgi:hypothetical protein
MAREIGEFVGNGLYMVRVIIRLPIIFVLV